MQSPSTRIQQVVIMTSVNSVRSVIAVGAVVALGLAAVVSGQTGQAAPQRNQMDELLAEVRAIRTDLDRAAGASLRGQLLGMRLQLQEQRIAALARQLSEVQARQRANDQTRGALLGSLKMFEQHGADKSKEFEFVFAPLKQQLKTLDQQDAELKNEEAQLSGQMHEEQSRWTAFNRQVEELEREAATKAVR
jgi:chromosome segregation ATPase